MSWAEVTKINSDLSVPLNELIEDKRREYSTNGFKYFYKKYTSKLSAETTIIDVQGSGLLYAVEAIDHYGNGTSYPAILRVAIDGEYVVNIERTSGVYDYYMYSLPFAPIKYSDYNGAIFSANSVAIHSMLNIASTYYADLPFETTSMSNKMYSWLSKPLKFSESLVVSVQHYYDSTYSYYPIYDCIYELLD